MVQGPAAAAHPLVPPALSMVPELLRGVWPPSALRQIGQDKRVVVISWKSPQVPAEVVQYLVQDDSGRITVVVSGADSDALIDGLEPGHAYRFAVTARTSAGWTERSPSVWVRTTPLVRQVGAPRLSHEDRDVDGFAVFMARVRSTDLLDAAGERRLGNLIRTGGPRGREAKLAFITANLRLVAHMANRFKLAASGTILDVEDLIQEGYLGLHRAVEKYDAGRGFKFSTYATWWIRQAISRAIANSSCSIRRPVHMHDRLVALRRALASLDADVDDPDPRSVRAAAEIEHEEPERILQMLVWARPVEEICAAVEEGEALNQSDELQDEDAWLAVLHLDPDLWSKWGLQADSGFYRRSTKPSWQIDPDAQASLDAVEQGHVTAAVRDALAALDARSQEILWRRFGMEETLEAIGGRLRLTRERIRQLEQEALAQVRNRLPPE